MTDGVAAVGQRISQIQTQLAVLAAPVTRPSSAATAATLARAGTFESALNQAVNAQADTSQAANAQTGASRAAVRLNADGVPTDLASYGNGKIPRSALAPIGRGEHRLWNPAARAFQQLTAAAERDGVRLGVTDSYRSYEQQVDVARRKGLYSQGGLAAKPGTSEHGWGLSLDLALDDRAQRWMRTNGTRFGFTENVPREPWHWTFSPTR